jgi:SAM-dependent methyltransferase
MSGKTSEQTFDGSMHYTDSPGSAYFALRAARRRPALQHRKAASIAGHIRPEWEVLDFGCGTGDILAHIDCRSRLGVEINPPSVASARANGLTVVNSLVDVESTRVDAALAYHSLEHVDHPSGVLTGLHRVLRAPGRLIVVVPAERPGARTFNHWYGDPNRHLFSWTPLSLGNLVASIGFKIERAFVRPCPTGSKYLSPFTGVPVLEDLLIRARARLVDHFETVCLAWKR